MAVELGAAAFSAFLQVTLDKLASGEIGDYFRGRKLNEKLLKKLNITLLSINAVVDDAEQKQIRNPHVKAWLDAVKDAVYEAEDLLDEVDIRVSQCKLEAESQSTSSSKVWTFFNASVISSFDKEIESKMQEVLDNLEHLARKKDILGLKEASSGFGVGSGRQVSQKLPSTSLPVESVIYGRDDDKEIIFNWLISDAENDRQRLSIISIVGMLRMNLPNDFPTISTIHEAPWTTIIQPYEALASSGGRILKSYTSSEGRVQYNSPMHCAPNLYIGQRSITNRSPMRMMEADKSQSRKHRWKTIWFPCCNCDDA